MSESIDRQIKLGVVPADTKLGHAGGIMTSKSRPTRRKTS